MARTIAEIQAQIIAAVEADATLSAQLTSTSVTAIWRLWTYIVAASVWTLETLFDSFKVETSALIAAQKPHTLRWYQAKALAYQHGGTLLEGSDQYDNASLTPDQIADMKIVAQAAAVEDPTNNAVVVKVAKDDGGELEPLDGSETTAITAYFATIKDAGVKLLVRSVNADRLRIEVDVYYDATILSSDGARLDGTDSEPVQTAVKAFLRAAPFDGEFVKAHLVDAMQVIEGVKVPDLKVCQARRDDDPSFSSVNVFYQPFAGYLKIYDEEDDLVLNFIAD
ncbi:MAG: hypothetical protein EPGJADBJ_04486 [Saprospiraceae bacterium]|nr:hypothetical protein [Saprospiraceae bacterium]